MSFTSNGINFIKEDQTGLLGPGHLKELTHHPGSLEHNKKKGNVKHVLVHIERQTAV